MTITTPSAALVPVAPVFTNTERLALAGFLPGYGGPTREAYELDLRQYASWCHQHHLRLLQVRRPAGASCAPSPGRSLPPGPPAARRSGADEAPVVHRCFPRPVLMILDRGSPPQVAASPRSLMGPQLVPAPGNYSGCQVTRSNSLPSGSANVAWRTAATPGGSAAGGSLIWLSGLAPRAVSRSVSSSWWSVTRTGWTLFLAVPGQQLPQAQFRGHHVPGGHIPVRHRPLHLNAASASTSVRPFSVARSAAIDSSGRPVRFASVSFRTGPALRGRSEQQIGRVGPWLPAHRGVGATSLVHMHPPAVPAHSTINHPGHRKATICGYVHRRVAAISHVR